MYCHTACSSYLPHQPAMESMEHYCSTIVTPSDKLHGIVSLFYQFEVKKAAVHLPIIPDGCMDLIFTITPSQVNGYFYGSIKKISNLVLEDCNLCFGLRFSPGMTGILFRQSAKEMNMSEPPVAIQIPFDGAFLKELSYPVTFEQRRDAVIRYITSRALEEHDIPVVVQFGLFEITRRSGLVSIDRLVEKSGYTSRYFRRIFLDHVGFSPKFFSEIIKFQKTFAALQKNGPSLSDVAQIGGYYDQSQMNKAYKKMTDCAPSKLPDLLSNGGDGRKISQTFQICSVSS